MTFWVVFIVERSRLRDFSSAVRIDWILVVAKGQDDVEYEVLNKS